MITERQLIHLRKTENDSCSSRYFMSCSCITFWFIEAAACVEVERLILCCMGLTLSNIWLDLFCTHSQIQPKFCMNLFFPWWPAKNNSVYSCHQFLGDFWFISGLFEMIYSRHTFIISKVTLSNPSCGWIESYSVSFHKVRSELFFFLYQIRVSRYRWNDLWAISPIIKL